MPKKEDRKIDFENWDSLKIEEFVIESSFSTGAYTIWNNRRFKIWDVTPGIIDILFAEMISDFSREKLRIGGPKILFRALMHGFLSGALEKIKPGEIFFVHKKFGIFVKTIDGQMLVNKIQEESSRVMGVRDYLNGHHLESHIDEEWILSLAVECCRLSNILVANGVVDLEKVNGIRDLDKYFDLMMVIKKFLSNE